MAEPGANARRPRQKTVVTADGPRPITEDALRLEEAAEAVASLVAAERFEPDIGLLVSLPVHDLPWPPWPRR